MHLWPNSPHRVGAWSMPDVWAAREQTRRSAWRLMHAGRRMSPERTESPDFPTAHAIQGTFGGTTDAFVTGVAPGGASIAFSTYLGGSGSDVSTAIAVDSAGRVHITGSTASPNFPVEHPLQPAYAGGYFYGDAFVAELAGDGQSSLESTYLGGNGDDVGTSIALDARGDAYGSVWWHEFSRFPRDRRSHGQEAVARKRLRRESDR